jgi:hypothetical protein
MARMVGSAVEGSCLLPGVYETLLAQEMASDGRPDPRYLLEPADECPPPSKQRHQRSKLLPSMLKGESVTVPRWRLGGHSIPLPRNVLDQSARPGVVRNREEDPTSDLLPGARAAAQVLKESLRR